MSLITEPAFRGDYYITPMYALDSAGVPEAGGTSTLLQVGTEKFLVTAAHVIDEGFLWFPIDGGFRRLNSAGVITNSPTELRRDDHGDLAFFHLTPEDVGFLHPFFRFVQMSDVDVNLSYKFRDRYEFTGFPWRKDELDRKLRKTFPAYTSITSETVSEKTFDLLQLSIHTHAVIAFQRNRMMVNGHKTTAALPDGMSGGAVWKRYPDSEVRKLAAIVIEHRKHCLIGTRLSVVLEYIRARFPHLSPLIPEPTDVELQITNNKRPVPPVEDLHGESECSVPEE